MKLILNLTGNQCKEGKMLLYDRIQEQCKLTWLLYFELFAGYLNEYQAFQKEGDYNNLFFLLLTHETDISAVSLERYFLMRLKLYKK